MELEALFRAIQLNSCKMKQTFVTNRLKFFLVCGCIWIILKDQIFIKFLIIWNTQVKVVKDIKCKRFPDMILSLNVKLYLNEF